MGVWIYSHMCICAYMNTNIHNMHICAHTYMTTHMQAHIYMHTHTKHSHIIMHILHIQNSALVRVRREGERQHMGRRACGV